MWKTPIDRVRGEIWSCFSQFYVCHSGGSICGGTFSFIRDNCSRGWIRCRFKGWGNNIYITVNIAINLLFELRLEIGLLHIEVSQLPIANSEALITVESQRDV